MQPHNDHMLIKQPRPYPTIALIVAAGRGSRLGGDMPKQYLPLAGKPVLRRTIKTFLKHPSIDHLRVMIHPDDEALYAQAVQGLSLLDPVFGGETRQESVRLGLESLEELNPSKVLIHDAARPFVSTRLISHIIEGLHGHKAVIPVLPIADTIKRVKDNVLVETVAREGLYLAQTPQGFHYPDIASAHARAKGLQLTDDAAVCEHSNIAVSITSGSTKNIKITTRKDLERAEKFVQKKSSLYETRIGTGFDVHKFKPPAAEDNRIMICGVAIPHDQAIEAHSDGDVGIHALVDALLGAMGKGDIGHHFPPSDQKWKNADSSAFLSHAAALVAEAHGRIVNIDVTVIGERPKISQFREAMRRRLAQILALNIDRVSVKATTTETLGFTGRKEGIAAQAVVSVSMPVN